MLVIGSIICAVSINVHCVQKCRSKKYFGSVISKLNAWTKWKTESSNELKSTTKWNKMRRRRGNFYFLNRRISCIYIKNKISKHTQENRWKWNWFPHEMKFKKEKKKMQKLHDYLTWFHTNWYLISLVFVVAVVDCFLIKICSTKFDRSNAFRPKSVFSFAKITHKTDGKKQDTSIQETKPKTKTN